MSTARDLQVMPELDADVLSAMRDSIRTFGVLVPIVVTQDGEIIDGHNRAQLAEELGVSCPYIVREVQSQQEAKQLAGTLNLDRRHLDAPTRAQLSRSLRAKGHSLRAIAGALGVHHSTVAEDLDEVEEVHLSGDPTGEKVGGLDGKMQPVTKRRWAADELAQLRQERDAGVSVADLAAKHGLGVGAIYKQLKKADSAAQDVGGQVEEFERLSAETRCDQIRERAAEGLTSQQIAKAIGVQEEYVRRLARRNDIEVPADRVLGRSRRIDSTRIADETVSTLEGVASSLRLVDTSDLDPAQCAEWATSISESLRVLTRFRNQLKEMTRESE